MRPLWCCVAAMCGEQGLAHHRESVRRAAAYGLAALSDGPSLAITRHGVPQLLRALSSDSVSTRKYAAFILGEIAPLTPEVLGGLSSVLRCDPSVYVRTNAAGALGFVGIRGLAEGGLSAPPLLLLLGEALEMLVPIPTRPSRPGAFDWDFPVLFAISYD